MKESNYKILELFQQRQAKDGLRLTEVKTNIARIMQDATQAVSAVNILQDKLQTVQTQQKEYELLQLDEAMLVLKKNVDGLERILEILTDLYLYFDKVVENVELEREVLVLLKEKLKTVG